MDFERFRKTKAKLIDFKIQQLLAELRNDTKNKSKQLLPLIDNFIDSCKGGKRLRGMLVVLGYELGKESTVYRLPASTRVERGEPSTARNNFNLTEAGSRKSEDILNIAAAYEIFHAAILAHDDIIDQSPLRRGQPSLYKALGGNHYGISQAICLGDAGFFLALKSIFNTNFTDKIKIEGVKWFNQIILNTVLGQMLDIDQAEPLTVANLKTAQYSMSGPLVLGAILAGGYHLEGVKAHLPGELEIFGESLGVAFQIKDDILDCESDRWGGQKAAIQKAQQYKNQALKVLPSITKDPKMSKLLEQLSEYLVERIK